MTIAIGFFDGVHLGHQAILKGVDRVITFINHPLAVLAPERAPRLLMRLDERLAAIKACGVGEVMALEFSPRLAETSPAEFAASVFFAADTRSAEKPVIRCGANWRFGRNGEGDAGFLRSLGYTVETVPFAEYRGERVSSTRIRQAIENGDIEAANAMLGRPYTVSGAVFSGKGEGGKIGFATINLKPGVYAVEAGGVKGIANYGVAPTFGERSWPEPVMEVHLLKYIRGEIKFDSVADLKAQIERDITSI